MPASSMTTSVSRPDGGDQAAVGLVGQVPGRAWRASRPAAGLLGERGSGGRRRREPEHVAAGLGPRGGQHPHRGGLAGPGRGEGELDVGRRRWPSPHQRGLGRVERDTVGGRGQHRQVDVLADRPVAVASCGGLTMRCSASSTAWQV